MSLRKGRTPARTLNGLDVFKHVSNLGGQRELVFVGG